MKAMDNTRNAGNGGKGVIKREIAAIPAWAFVLAAILFVCIPIVFVFFVFRGANDAPLPFAVLVSILPGTFLAFLALMVGYVNRDAGLRGMNRKLWTLIVIFVPNAIGFILYFLLRSPIRTECPSCRAVVGPGANYCPNCRYSFGPTCPQCQTAARPGDKFCANCAAEIGR